MKKILLSTAALISFFAVSKARAEPAIELNLGGYMNFYGAYANQRQSTEVPTVITYPPLAYTSARIGDYNHYDLMGNAEIYFSGSYTFENDVKIGAMVQLEAGTDSDTSNHVIDETYMTIDSKAGRVIVGNVKNVSNMMAVRSPSVSTLGFQETDFTRLLVVPTLFAYNKATYATIDDISTKLSYITPKMAGFTVGVSLMPGNKVKGKDANNLLIPQDGLKVFKYGIDAVALYQHDFGKVTMDVSGAFSTYKPNLLANNIFADQSNTNEYGGGLVLSVGNWSFGGSYHYVNSSQAASELAAAVQTMGAHGYTWEAGVKYSFDAFSTSANYMQSKADSFTTTGKDEYNQYQISARYRLAAGIDVFTDIAYIEYKAANDLRGLSNQGVSAAVGMNLMF